VKARMGKKLLNQYNRFKSNKPSNQPMMLKKKTKKI